MDERKAEGGRRGRVVRRGGAGWVGRGEEVEGGEGGDEAVRGEVMEEGKRL